MASQELMTTQALRQSSDAADAPVTEAQLARWVAKGWLPPSIKRGLGYGRGTVQLWPVEALPLAVLLARSVRQGPGSEQAVARVLYGAGYRVPNADTMRAFVWKWLDSIKSGMSRQRAFLDDESSVRVRLDKISASVRSRNPDLNGSLAQVVAAAVSAVVGIAPAEAKTALNRALQRCTFPELDSLISRADDVTIITAAVTALEYGHAVFTASPGVVSLFASVSSDVERAIVAVPPPIILFRGKANYDQLKFMSQEGTRIACNLMAEAYLAIALSALLLHDKGGSVAVDMEDALEELYCSIDPSPDTTHFRSLFRTLRIRIDQVRQEQRRKEQNDFADRVLPVIRLAARQLKEQGRRVSRSEIAKIVGLSDRRLRANPKIMSVLEGEIRYGNIRD